jgi:23S rRNA (pseudouridine1915-N3)-methyltransferase
VKILLLILGKTGKKYIREGFEDYVSRIGYYLPFDFKIIPDLKNSGNVSVDIKKEKEGQLILGEINKGDQLVLLDERGLEFSSTEFSRWIEKKMMSAVRQIVFVIGGPYGFSEAVYQRADHKISLSRMTFSHQIVRMIFVEQLYRAMTIIRNEPYHHD